MQAETVPRSPPLPHRMRGSWVHGGLSGVPACLPERHVAPATFKAPAVLPHWLCTALCRMASVLCRYHPADFDEKLQRGAPCFAFVFNHVSIQTRQTRWHRDGRDVGLGVIGYLGSFRGGAFAWRDSCGERSMSVQPDDVLIYEPTVEHRAMPWDGSRVAIVAKRKVYDGSRPEPENYGYA